VLEPSGVKLALVAALVATAFAPSATSSPAIQLIRIISTTPFPGTIVSVGDGEGSAYVPVDRSIWLVDDRGVSAYEIDAATGALKRSIAEPAFQAAPPASGMASPASTRITGQLESMAYDPRHDVLYAFSSASSSSQPASFRFTRGVDGALTVESHQRLPPEGSLTAAAFNPHDGRVYVGGGTTLRAYDYATNQLGPDVKIRGLQGILGMSFSADGADLYVVTSGNKLYRLDWATRAPRSGWEFDLGPFGLGESRAVEVVDDQLFVLDGSDARPAGDPLRYGMYVFGMTGPRAPARGPSTVPPQSVSQETENEPPWSWPAILAWSAFIGVLVSALTMVFRGRRTGDS
jgi:hypothetical protein